MKKLLAVFLSILSAAAFFGIAFLNLMLWGILWTGGVAIGVVITIGAAFGLNALRALFAKRFGFSAPMFLTCAYLPSVVISAAFWGIAWIAKNFSLLWVCHAISWRITSAVAVASGLVIFAISAAVRKRKGNVS